MSKFAPISKILSLNTLIYGLGVVSAVPGYIAIYTQSYVTIFGMQLALSDIFWIVPVAFWIVSVALRVIWTIRNQVYVQALVHIEAASPSINLANKLRIASGVIFACLGALLVYLGNVNAGSTISLFGATINTGSVGVASIAIGAVTRS
jgi:hypothetical protein